MVPPLPEPVACEAVCPSPLRTEPTPVRCPYPSWRCMVSPLRAWRVFRRLTVTVFPAALRSAAMFSSWEVEAFKRSFCLVPVKCKTHGRRPGGSPCATLRTVRKWLAGGRSGVGYVQQPREVRGSTADAKGRHLPCLPVIVSMIVKFPIGAPWCARIEADPPVGFLNVKKGERNVPP